MKRHTPNPLRRHECDSGGFTLIELIISITLLSLITGAITASFITAFNANANSAERVHESNDAQIIAAFWTRDAQAAGGSDPRSGTPDASLGVSTTDSGGCALGGATLVMRFMWNEWTSQTVHTLRVANYAYRSGLNELERRTCKDDTQDGVVNLVADGVVGLATRVGAAPVPAATCLPDCTGIPTSVSLRVTETNNPSTGAPPETSSTSKPPAANARASIAARRRWPIPSRCCT